MLGTKREVFLMKRSLIFSIGILTATTFAAAAEEITVSGCAAAGVEPNCIILEADGKTYNISTAQPAPVPGTYGTIKGTLTVQACDPNSCLPPKKLAFEAKLSEPVELSEAARSAISHTGVPAPIGGLPPTLEETPADFRADGSHVIWRGQILPDVAMPGEEVLVHLTAEPVEDFHLYGYEPKDPRTPGASKPTLVLLTAVVSPLILYWFIQKTGWLRFLFERPAWAHLPGTPGSRSYEAKPRMQPAE